MATSKRSMDCLPSQDVIDGITVALFPKPSNSQPPKRNSIEYFIHITERISKSTFHGGCMFCGHNRKWTVGQIRIHFTKESEGATHVHACPQVPQEITQFYRDVRDAFLQFPCPTRKIAREAIEASRRARQQGNDVILLYGSSQDGM